MGGGGRKRSGASGRGRNGRKVGGDGVAHGVRLVG